jgi:hypothetical protein
MIPYKSPLQTAVPQSLEKRLEIMNAIRTLAAGAGRPSPQAAGGHCGFAPRLGKNQGRRARFMAPMRAAVAVLRHQIQSRSAARAGRQSWRRAMDE